jgi:hypothetical protein
MFTHHTTIFVTFDPLDGGKARNFVRSLQRRFPDRIFLGRHIDQTDQEAALSVLKTTVTLILETKNTASSRTVKHDIEISLAKDPRNEILRILLDAEEQMPDGCAVMEILASEGTEHVAADLTTVAEAFCRLDVLGRREPKIRDAVGRKSPIKKLCPPRH